MVITLTLKEEKVAKKCHKNREIFFATFKEKVAGIKCQENSKIKTLRKFKVANCWK